MRLSHGSMIELTVCQLPDETGVPSTFQRLPPFSNPPPNPPKLKNPNPFHLQQVSPSDQIITGVPGLFARTAPSPLSRPVLYLLDRRDEVPLAFVSHAISNLPITFFPPRSGLSFWPPPIRGRPSVPVPLINKRPLSL